MNRIPFISSLLFLGACNSITSEESPRKIDQPCGDKPNCISSQDKRDKFNSLPIRIKKTVSIKDIKKELLEMPGSTLIEQDPSYLRFTFTSRILRFIDDFEVKVEGNTLHVRSESRTGYSDFGVNKKRVEDLRLRLKNANMLESIN
ncbi:DUF1499 domain-containing protein [Vibrio sp.]|nr:DUF1499 domain-containing protein [Vibrio sp.]